MQTYTNNKFHRRGHRMYDLGLLGYIAWSPQQQFHISFVKNGISFQLEPNCVKWSHTCIAASLINIFAVSSQMAGTVNTKSMSSTVTLSVSLSSNSLRRCSFMCRIQCIKTVMASIDFPFSAIHSVFLWTRYKKKIILFDKLVYSISLSNEKNWFDCIDIHIHIYFQRIVYKYANS